MRQENGEPAIVTKLLIIAGCAGMIAAIAWLIILEQSGSHPTPLPPAPSAFYPAHWKPQELEAVIGHSGFLSAIAEATDGTVCRLSADGAETETVRSLLQSDLSRLRQVLSNHLSYGIEYARIKDRVYLLHLLGPEGDVEFHVAADGMELCVTAVDGQECNKWFACSEEARVVLNSIGRNYLSVR